MLRPILHCFTLFTNNPQAEKFHGNKYTVQKQSENICQNLCQRVVSFQHIIPSKPGHRSSKFEKYIFIKFVPCPSPLHICEPFHGVHFQVL